ncbi:isopropylmalate isomerase [Paracoccus benzoatiresistens]|uniref:Isopropylmalate isomerase n=1 Tax=Paracoccus benzoatiresistens TaxID=2997341 RepID=A0ABT4J9N7_9RHOB|nr:isopropylmalate isomerase [Paracoccus sp. EF6]MCZ0963312.1 isopropylmalate isomerase [Paracoccus sp. EF6]
MLDCVLARWQPGIGDPTWQGWATVLVYLAAGVSALYASHTALPAAAPVRERLFWNLTWLVLVALAVNKQLDLQSALTAGGRCLAQAQGWYDQRHLVQIGFLMGLAALALVFLTMLLVLLRGSLSRSALPIMGFVFVCTFVLMRAIGFHDADQFLGLPVLGLRANTILEWIGPALISLGAIRLARFPVR